MAGEAAPAHLSHVSAAALAGMTLGGVEVLARGAPGDLAHGLVLWGASGFLLGGALVLLASLARAAAVLAGRVFMSPPAPPRRRVRVFLAAVPLLWLAAEALREAVGRPGFSRLGDPLLLALGLSVMGLLGALALAWICVVRPPFRSLLPAAALGLTAAGGVLLLSKLPFLRIALAPLPRARLLLVVSLVLLGTQALRRPAATRRGIAIAGWIAGLAALGLLRLHPLGAAGTTAPTGLGAALEDLLPETDGAAVSGSKASDDVLRGFFARGHAGARAELDRLVRGRRRMNVLWVTICTLRHDRLGVFGNERGITPAIDALAEKSLLFERAYSTFPATAYSVTSMFSGRYPSQTARFLARVGRPSRAEAFWLPEALRRAGFQTWALTALDETLLQTQCEGLLRGFDVRNPYPHLVAPPAEVVAAAFERRLAGRDAERPFFSWVMMLDPHNPYEGDPEGPPLGTDQQDLYDGEVRRTDRAVGRLLAAIDAAGLADETIVVLHADHGEEFDEHGGAYHYGSVYDEQVHVPLMLRVPGLVPGRSSVPVDMTDLAPTLTEILDVPEPRGTVGDSLVPLLLGKEMASCAGSELLFPEQPSRDVRMIVGPDLKKLIVRRRRGSRELYDLVRDPGERWNLAGRGDPREEELAGLLEALHGADPASFSRFPDLPQASWASIHGTTFKSSDLMRECLEGDGADAALLVKTLGLVRLLGRSDLAPLALRFARHEAAGVRREVLEVAVRFKLAGAPEVVLAALRDPAREVRLKALQALPGCAREGDLEQVRALRPSDVEERLDRALCLARLGVPGELPLLDSAAPELPPVHQARWAAGMAVFVGDGRGREILEAFVRIPEADRDARLVAVEALRVLGSPVFFLGARGVLADPALDLQQAFRVLAGIDVENARGRGVLLLATDHPEPQVRARALRALEGRHDWERVQEGLRALCVLRGSRPSGVEGESWEARRRSARETLRKSGFDLPGDGWGDPPAPAARLEVGEGSFTDPRLAGRLPVLLRVDLKPIAPRGAIVRVFWCWVRDGRPVGPLRHWNLAVEDLRRGPAALPLPGRSGPLPTGVRLGILTPERSPAWAAEDVPIP